MGTGVQSSCAATVIPCVAMLRGLVAFVQKPVNSMLGGSPAFLLSLNLSNLGCVYRLSLASC